MPQDDDVERDRMPPPTAHVLAMATVWRRRTMTAGVGADAVIDERVLTVATVVGDFMACMVSDSPSGLPPPILGGSAAANSRWVGWSRRHPECASALEMRTPDPAEVG